MTPCELWDSAEIELYFYGELDDVARARVAAHLHTCLACRQRLDDLRTITRELATQPTVDAPPAGDWSGFTRRLQRAIATRETRPPDVAVLAPRVALRATIRQLAVLAATLAIAALGVYMAARVQKRPTPTVASLPLSPVVSAPEPAKVTLTPDAALRDVTAEHLERSKLVVLGLAARDPQTTGPADWQYERKLAGTLLPETRLYRLAAQERGVEDVAHVMRDLETVLLEASMSDARDRESLERVQRLIARRGLVSKIQMVTTSAGL